MKKHPNLPSGGGMPYLIENVFRALRDLCDGSMEWREQIKSACSNAHRPGDTEFYTGYMSDETLQAWRDCSTSRFKKRFDDLSGEEVQELAASLQNYIYYMSRDKGICEAGGDPKTHNPYGEFPREEGGLIPPARNKEEV